MKQKKSIIKHWVLVVCLCVFPLGVVFGGDTETIVVKPVSQLWLEGDSTMHAYKSHASSIQGDILFHKGAINKSLVDLVRQKHWEKFLLTIPVKGMKSGKSGLDKKMVESLKADQFPNITFRMKNISLISPTPLKVKVSGSLTVAGAEKNIELEATLEKQDGGFWIQGKKDLLMTDFGITPPKALLGAVKADNKITIHYKILAGMP